MLTMTQLVCKNTRCGRPFELNQSGRPKEYCGKKCREASYRARFTANHAADQQFLSELQEITADLRSSVNEVASLAHGSPSSGSPDMPVDVLRRTEGILKLLKMVEAGAVQLARHRRVPAAQTAAALGISPDTLRDRWPRATVTRTVARRRRLPVPSPREGSADTAEMPRFALALSTLHRHSDLSMRQVAATAQISASYVSRVMSGERVPSWRVARDMASACGGEPNEIRPLWAAARRLPVPGRVDLRVLREALRGLRLSAGSPSVAAICLASRGRLTEEGLAQLLHDAHPVPPWGAVAAYCSALRCSSQELRPLWDATWSAAHPYGDQQSSTGRLRLPAASFG